MNKIKQILIVVCVICVAVSISVYGQPKTPYSVEEIPDNIPSDVRKQIEKLSSSDSYERLIGALRLGELGERAIAAVPYLIEMIGDDKKISILRGYGATSPGIEAFHALNKISTNWDDSELAKKKSKRIMPDLVARLEDSTMLMYLRYATALYLTRLKDPAAIEPLIATLKDENKDFTKMASKALKEITGKNFGEDQAKWQKWWNENKDKY